MDRIMLDFNGADMGVVVRPGEAPSGVTLGSVVHCIDEDANTCDAQVIEIEATWIRLEMMWETFRDGPRLATTS